MGTASSSRVLIVEDNLHDREACAELCRAEGFEVAEVTNGQEALDYLSRHPKPRLILLDLAMPGMDGGELRRLMLADEHLASIPVAVLSGTYVRFPRDWLGVPLFRKPVNVAELTALLQRHR